MKRKLMIYGASGYLGRLASTYASEKGITHIAAGRDIVKIAKHTRRLRRRPGAPEPRVFKLTDEANIEGALDDVAVVLNCAAPMADTAEPLIRACIATGTHYVDVAASLDRLEAVETRDALAKSRNVTVLTGAGFLTTGSDALARAYLERAPETKSLLMAIKLKGRLSRGTLREILRASDPSAPHAGDVVDGDRRPPKSARPETLDLHDGPAKALPAPWLSAAASAHRGTRLPSVRAFVLASARTRDLLRRRGLRGRLLATGFGARLASRLIGLRRQSGKLMRRFARVRIYAYSPDNEAAGHLVLAGPGLYDFAARSAILSTRRIQAGEAPPGVHTPATAFSGNLLDGITGAHIGVPQTETPEEEEPEEEARPVGASPVDASPAERAGSSVERERLAAGPAES